MDRLTSIFLDSRPTNQLTARFPLQPFLDSATRLSYDDPRRWIYTTIDILNTPHEILIKIFSFLDH